MINTVLSSIAVLFPNLAQTIVSLNCLIHQCIADVLCWLAIVLTHHAFKVLPFLFVAAVIDADGIKEEKCPA